MKYVKGLIEKKLNKWKGKKWYHQRFDASPYFIHFIAEAHINTLTKRKKGGDFTVHYCFFENGKGDWYMGMKDIKKIYTSIIKAAKKDSKISANLMKLWKKEEDLFIAKCFEVGALDLKKFSDKELIKLHDDFCQITYNRFSSSSLIDGFALGTDQLIADKIKVIYENSKIKNKKIFTKVFSALTAPAHLSFINKAEIELIKMALKIKKDKKSEAGLLKEYQQEYFWIRNNYSDYYILDVKYFKKEVGELLSLGINLEEEIKRLKSIPAENRKNKICLMKAFKIKGELKSLLKISEDFTHWQDERKKSVFLMAHYFSLILEEICQRKKIPIRLIKYLLPREVSFVFQKNINLKDLQARENNSLFFWDKEGFDVTTGKMADKVKKAILGSAKLDNIDDFRGLSASTGKAVGPVKILKSVKEVGKINKGDILVAIMTRPDYIPAMKKAAAIVTDEGGVTCHAAIVSRELGIPCIIGTKIATKVLHDGDLVEVNANHGWVKVVKRA